MSRVMRAGRRVVVAVTLVVVAFLAWERITFDRAAWLADYEQLREHVPAVYANLLWTLRERQIDPVALHTRTLAKLKASGTDRAAREVIAEFVDTFADGHFVIKRVKLSKRIAVWWAGLGKGDESPAPLTATTDGDAACGALGFGDADGGLRFGLAAVAGFTALGDTDNGFAAGIVPLADGRRVGVVRISSFDQHSYRGACVRAWTGFRARAGERCGEHCEEQFVHVEVPNQVLAELAARAQAFTAAGVDRVVVDLTGNGGGTDWVDPAARMFSAQSLVCPQLIFIKHPHWTGRLAGLRAEIEEDLRGEWSAPERAVLEDARARVDRLLARAQEPCDLRSIWTWPGPPSCTNLVEEAYFACGVFGEPPTVALAGARSRWELFAALGYRYAPGVYAGPLMVLVDDRTASAAEHFAAMLADNGAARILGARTKGSGCGYTGGGVPAVLQGSGLTIAMPDCQRRRRDGANELAGIEPDVAIAWADGDDEAAARDKLLVALADG